MKEAFKSSAIAAGILSWLAAMVVLAYAVFGWDFDLLSSLSVIAVVLTLPLFLALDILIFAIRKLFGL